MENLHSLLPFPGHPVANLSLKMPTGFAVLHSRDAYAIFMRGSRRTLRSWVSVSVADVLTLTTAALP